MPNPSTPLPDKSHDKSHASEPASENAAKTFGEFFAGVGLRQMRVVSWAANFLLRHWWAHVLGFLDLILLLTPCPAFQAEP